jgi:hypothetical protein
MADWKGSCDGCGAHGRWFDGSVGFIDGGTVGFWSQRRGKSEFHREFRGAHKPVPFAKGRKFVGLDAVWDVREHKALFALEIPDPSVDFDVVGFSLDERFLFGAQPSRRPSRLLVWSLQDGSIVSDLSSPAHEWATSQTDPHGFIISKSRWDPPRHRAAHHDPQSGRTLWFVPLVETNPRGDLVNHWMVTSTAECHWGKLPWSGGVPIDGIPPDRCTEPSP